MKPWFLRGFGCFMTLVVYGIPSLLIIYGLSYVQDPFRYPFGIGVMSTGIFVILIAKIFDYI